jgi:hypothetical protein
MCDEQRENVATYLLGGCRGRRRGLRGDKTQRASDQNIA